MISDLSFNYEGLIWDPIDPHVIYCGFELLFNIRSLNIYIYIYIYKRGGQS